ncbi:hypothetical protein PoB_001255700 [Plakobranchus ocellatus]|uniref:Uncharacterized protein n=1 Tax=Plakobranchus ocellatus TaxID=259542 RepID=A0AAV3YUA2_9GAST|nr:hypothetical protein PoB_001255700 [Plakobranchus ocellatus]
MLTTRRRDEHNIPRDVIFSHYQLQQYSHGATRSKLPAGCSDSFRPSDSSGIGSGARTRITGVHVDFRVFSLAILPPVGHKSYFVFTLNPRV